MLGPARNGRLEEKIAVAIGEAAAAHERSGAAERVFRDFDWTTRESWSRERRVVAKAEHLVGGKSNPRFVVTNLSRRSWSPTCLYEGLYCARGEAENRIKEQQLGLFGTRLSTPTLQGNAVRMAILAMAYVLTCALRRLELRFELSTLTHSPSRGAVNQSTDGLEPASVWPGSRTRTCPVPPL